MHYLKTNFYQFKIFFQIHIIVSVETDKTAHWCFTTQRRVPLASILETNY